MATNLKTIRFTEEEWLPVYNQLAKMYQDRPSVILIRSAMKRELGFLVRRHREWSELEGEYTFSICVDFYRPESETWFRLTFL